MSWWDYGHWITRISHRLPNANPSRPTSGTPAQLFSAQDEDSANELMDKLGMRYVIVDYYTATSKFHAVATLADRNPEDFFDVYYLPQEDRLLTIQLFYPEYYHSLAIRLYNFDGKAVTPESAVVISFQPKIGRDGKTYKVITSSKSFSDYEEAIAYVSSQKSDDYRIVGTSSFISPVPLAALEHYQLVYKSEGAIRRQEAEPMPEIKIFEYVK